MGRQIHDEEILAYAWGDLDRQRAAEVARAVENNPALAADVDRLRRDRVALINDFPGSIARGAFPSAAASNDPGRPGNRRRSSTGRSDMRFTPLAWAGAAAATVLLAVAGYGAGLWQAERNAVTALDVMAAIDTVRNDALETTANAEAMTASLPDGATVRVTPLSTYMDDAGRYCRTYETVIRAGDQATAMQGHACRSDAGDWPVQAQQPTETPIFNTNG